MSSRSFGFYRRPKPRFEATFRGVADEVRRLRLDIDRAFSDLEGYVDAHSSSGSPVDHGNVNLIISIAVASFSSSSPLTIQTINAGDYISVAKVLIDVPFDAPGATFSLTITPSSLRRTRESRSATSWLDLLRVRSPASFRWSGER